MPLNWHKSHPLLIGLLSLSAESRMPSLPARPQLHPSISRFLAWLFIPGHLEWHPRHAALNNKSPVRWQPVEIAWELLVASCRLQVGYAEERIVTGSLWSGEREPPNAMCAGLLERLKGGKGKGHAGGTFINGRVSMLRAGDTK